MVNIDKELSDKIKVMSFISACFVVFIHAPHGDGLATYLVKDWIAGIAVPFFFIVSGFFWLNNYGNKGWWLDSLGKRFWTLFIPFLFINVVFFLVKYPIHYVAVNWFSADGSAEIMRITFANFLLGISPLPDIGFPVYAPFWYIRALLIMMFVSPLLMWIIKRSKLTCSCYIVGLLILWIGASYMFNAAGMDVGKHFEYEFSPRCWFYFSLGMAIRYWGRVKISKISALLCGVLGASFHLLSFTCPRLGIILNILSLMFVLASIWGMLPSVRCKSFACDSFSVYAFHFMVIYLLGAAVKAVKLGSILNTELGMLMMVCCSVLLSCMLGGLVRRHSPLLTRLFLGGR